MWWYQVNTNCVVAQGITLHRKGRIKFQTAENTNATQKIRSLRWIASERLSSVLQLALLKYLSCATSPHNSAQVSRAFCFCELKPSWYFSLLSVGCKSLRCGGLRCQINLRSACTGSGFCERESVELQRRALCNRGWVRVVPEVNSRRPQTRRRGTCYIAFQFIKLQMSSQISHFRFPCCWRAILISRSLGTHSHRRLEKCRVQVIFLLDHWSGWK